MDQGDEVPGNGLSLARTTFRDPVTAVLSSPNNVARERRLRGYASVYGSKGIPKIVGLAVCELSAILTEVNGIRRALVESVGDFITPILQELFLYLNISFVPKSFSFFFL